MVLELIEGLFKNLNIKAFDIVEVSPTLDCNDITSWLALKTIYEVLNILKEKL
jgi:arginase family enzyme